MIVQTTKNQGFSSLCSTWARRSATTIAFGKAGTIMGGGRRAGRDRQAERRQSMSDVFLQGNWNDSLTFTFTLTPSDIFLGSYAMLYRKATIWILYGLSVMVLLFMIPFAVLAVMANGLTFEVVSGPICVVVFVAAFLLAFQPGMMWLRSRAVVRQTPSVQGPQSFTIGHPGMIVTSDLTRTELRWGAFVKVVESRSAFLFYVSGGRAFVLPKRALVDADDLSHLRHVLSASLGSKARLQRTEND
jgi:hypothetical protein